MGVLLQLTPVRTVEEFEGAFETMTKERVDALFVVASSLTGRGRAAPELLAELAMKHRLPSMFGYKASVVAGGLMSYSANYVELTRLAATYIDKILKGAKPADLPVEQATRFELVHQHEDRKGARAHDPAYIAGFRQRSDRISCCVLRCLKSAFGTSRTFVIFQFERRAGLRRVGLEACATPL